MNRAASRPEISRAAPRPTLDYRTNMGQFLLKHVSVDFVIICVAWNRWDYSHIFRKSQINRELSEGIRKNQGGFSCRLPSVETDKRNKRLQIVTARSPSAPGLPARRRPWPASEGERGEGGGLLPHIFSSQSPNFWHKTSRIEDNIQKDGNYIWGICGKRGDAVGKNFMQEDGKNQPSAPGSGSSGTSERSSARSFWSSLEGNVSFR